MDFGCFWAKKTTVLLRGQCHAHLFFCKKPARLQLSLCARSSKLSSQQHQCSYSLCTASNSTVVAGTGSRSLQNYCSGSLHHQNQPRFSRPLGLLYVLLLLPMVLLCTRKGSSFYATSILVYILLYALEVSAGLHWPARAAGPLLLAKLASFCNMTRLVNAMAVHLSRSKADRSKLIHFSCTALAFLQISFRTWNFL